MVDYKIMLFDNYDVYKDYDKELEYVGILFIDGEKDILLSIIYMRDLFKKFHKNCGIFKHSKGIDIFISPLFMEQYKNKTDLFAALMFHELGHYVNGDLSDENFKNLDKRNDFINTGKVSDMEIKADAFAAAYVGKALMIQALNNVINERKIRNDEYADLAIRELKERIRILNKNKTIL